MVKFSGKPILPLPPADNPEKISLHKGFTPLEASHWKLLNLPLHFPLHKGWG